MTVTGEVEQAADGRVRRPVTVLFADVVGSTAIAERLDPEDWADLMALTHRRIGSIVERHGGTVAQVLGDGLLAFFGAPTAHEDDPVRAVEAGLDIVAAGPEIRSEARVRPAIDIALRVGVNTGPVVVGDIGAGGRVEYLAFGDAVNVAARLEAAATPATVRVSATTYRLVAPFFEARDVGRLGLRGKAEPVRTFEVVGRKETPDRIRGLPGVASVMVGRSRELAELLRRSEALRGGEGGVIAIVGEPGIGKTRLLAEWRRELGGIRGPAPNVVGWVEAHCAAEAAGVPYQAVVGLLRALLGLGLGAGGASIRAALGSLLSPAAALEAVPSVAHLLALELTPEETAEIDAFDPRGLHVQYASALGRILRARAQRTPIVVAIEDVHWIDPASSELLAPLWPATVELPILFAFTARPERESVGWSLLRAGLDAPGLSTAEIALGPLSPAESEALVGQLLSADEAAGRLRSLVAARSEGNPFFLEEIVRSLREEGEVTLAEEALGRVERRPTAVPETLRGLLLSRIDRLPADVRATMRVAAVIGRRFSVRLLDAALAEGGPAPGREDSAGPPRGGSDRQGDLDTLEAAGLVDPVPGPAELEYTFRHALIQEAAYDELVRPQRARLHAMVGRAIERSSPGRLDELSPLLARHFAAAGDTSHAVDYLIRAAARAEAAYAHVEGEAMLKQALELAATDDAVARARAAELHEMLGVVLTLTGRHAEAIGEFRQAIALAEAGDTLDLVRRHRQIAACLNVTAQRAEALAELDLASGLLGPPGAEPARWSEWIEIAVLRIMVLYFVADVEAVGATIEAAREPVARWATPVQRARYLDMAPSVAWLTERFAMSDATVAAGREALAAAQESGSLSILGQTHMTLGLTLILRLELDEAERELTTAARISARIGDDGWGCRSLNYLALLERFRGNPDGVARHLDELEPRIARAGMVEYVPQALANRAWLAWRAGDGPSARTLAERSLADPIPTPLEFIARWPLLAVAVAENDVAEGIEQARALLAPPQYILKPQVGSPLGAAVAAWDAREASEADRRLREALAEAQRVGYL